MEAAAEALRGPIIEYFHIRMFGRRQERMRELLEAARRSAVERLGGRSEVFASNYGQWVKVQKTTTRTLESVVLPEGELERLVEDVREFLESRAWYAAHGLAWCRNFLLSGVMGSGKTIAIEAVAHEFRINLYMLNVSGTMMSDERLHQLMLAIPPGSIVLVEEVDEAVPGGTVKSADHTSKVTFQGLLQALDGIASREGCMIFLTTNHVERLDERLIRDGRVDFRMEFTHATASQCERIYRRFYPDAGAERARQFAAALGGARVGMSSVETILVKHKNDPEGALAGGP